MIFQCRLLTFLLLLVDSASSVSDQKHIKRSIRGNRRRVDVLKFHVEAPNIFDRKEQEFAVERDHKRAKGSYSSKQSKPSPCASKSKGKCSSSKSSKATSTPTVAVAPTQVPATESPSLAPTTSIVILPTMGPTAAQSPSLAPTIDTVQPTLMPMATAVCLESSARCLFGLGFAMFRGVQDTDRCDEICSFSEILREGFECGFCPSTGSPFPTTATASPTQVPTTSPPAQPPVIAPTATTAPTTAPTTAAPIVTPTTDTPDPSASPTIITTSPPTQTPVDSPSSGPSALPTVQAFDITLDLIMPDEEQAIFRDAAATWESVVVGDLPEIGADDIAGFPPPFDDGCAYPSSIDDIYICGVVAEIDGPGNVAGQARPTLLRSESLLPVAGEMTFDTADLEGIIEQDLLGVLIRHEMGHVLGIGSIWTTLGLTGPDSENCPYFGLNAIEEYKAISGCDELPVEQTGGAGTRCFHWSEDCLDRELMTGQLDFGVSPLSRITVATLDDMGYVVSYETADAFGESDLNESCLCPTNRKRTRNLLEELWDGHHGDVLPLETPSKQVKRRLSESLRQQAIEYGLAILEESARAHSTKGGNTDILYVGDKVISVLMRQDNDFFGVMVVRDEV